MPALLIFAITALSLVESVFLKQYNNKHNKGNFIFMAFISLFSMSVFLITDTGGFNVPPTLWIYAILAGVLYCSASFLTFVAFGCGSFALSSLILGYAMVFSIGYGLFFLGETANIFTWIGLVLIMISLYLTKAKKENAEAGDKITPTEEDGEKPVKTRSVSLKWVVCIGLSVVGSGMYGVLSRMQQIVFNNECTNEFMVITLGFSALCLFVIGFIREGRDFAYVIKHGAIWGALAGCSNGLNNMLGLILNLMMAISISAPVKAGARVIVSFVISMLIFKERFERRQIVGVILGGIALVLLNLKI